MIRFLSIILVLFCFIQTSYSQSTDVRTNELNEWANIKVKKKITSDLQVYVAPQVRLEKTAIKKYLVETGAKYELTKHFDLGIGYRYSHEQKKKREENIHRFDVDISASTKAGGLKPEIRVQFNTEKDQLEDERLNTLRYKGSLEYSAKKSSFKPFILGELFQELPSNGISKIRSGIGTDIKISKHHSLDVAYLLDYGLEKEKNAHIISIGYDFDF